MKYFICVLKEYICPLLFYILQLNLKSYMDLLLIWGPMYPQKIIFPYFYPSCITARGQEMTKLIRS